MGNYILPPTGPLFRVNDHVNWAIDTLFPEYKEWSGGKRGDNADLFYQKIKSLGYLTVVFEPYDGELFIRHPLKYLSKDQRKRLEDFAEQRILKGGYWKITLFDDKGEQEVLYSKPENVQEIFLKTILKEIGQDTGI